MPLSEPETHEAREAFSLFDRDSSGKMDIAELPTVLRSLGYIPSASALKEMQNDADPNNSGYAKVGDFLRQVEKAAAVAQTSKQEALKQLPWLKDGIRFFMRGESLKSVWEKEEDFVSVADLKRAMTRTGEQLSEEEVNELFRELQTYDGEKVRFADFVKLLTSI